MSAQLDLFEWRPPPKRPARKHCSTGDDARPCRCGQNIGRGWVWRDDAGVDYIECEGCLSPPRMPYWRPRTGPYVGSIGEREMR